MAAVTTPVARNLVLGDMCCVTSHILLMLIYPAEQEVQILELVQVRQPVEQSPQSVEFRSKVYCEGQVATQDQVRGFSL